MLKNLKKSNSWVLKLISISTYPRSYISLSEFSSNSVGDKDIRSTTTGLPRACLQNGKYISPWTKETNKSFSAVIKMILERNSIQKFIGISDSVCKILRGEANLGRMLNGSSYTWVCLNIFLGYTFFLIVRALYCRSDTRLVIIDLMGTEF